MPTQKFQPKDARAIPFTYRYDEDDDLSEVIHERRPKTANHYLIEFLDKGPEDVHHPSKSNTLFNRIKKTKRNNTASSASTVSSVRSVPSSTTSLPISTNNTNSSLTLTSSNQYHRRAPDVTPQKTKSATTISRNDKPILPNKKRESSLYSAPLRHSLSVRSTTSYSRRSVPLSGTKATEIVMARRSESMDTIEFALMQRLERMKVMDEPLPSDQVATGLSAEHIRALGITHILDNPQQKSDKKVRHMQVQTERWSESSSQVSVEHEADNHVSHSREKDPEIRARRAEAALENAYDHLEVMSGLAYKKLRELWEEKTRWETACMELRDRLLVLEQKQQQQQQQQQDSPLLREDYHHALVEDEDELGLSEFPIAERKQQ
ncbi:hypothetical protein EDC96DRAFT_448450 [Choanephora cucurbitarum]|nr:hypothetical protein EDC96DRAFT_448450 [Choanephora cucurbitarum]